MYTKGSAQLTVYSRTNCRYTKIDNTMENIKCYLEVDITAQVKKKNRTSSCW